MFEMSNGCIVGSTHRAPLQALSELMELRVGSSRPLCNLLIQQPNFIVEPLTKATGREVACTSLLGPFLAVSVFAEDDPRVAAKYFESGATFDKGVTHGLQAELESTRVRF